MKPKHQILKSLVFFSLSLALVGLPLAALASSNQTIIVAANEIVEGNFIKVGNTIDIAGNVNGDVIVAGSSITISGDVAGDVIAAGNTIRILGEVAGSVRLAGSAIEINNRVGHNVWAVGSTVSIGPEAQVGWDVFSAGANVEVRGPVERSAWLAGVGLLLDSKIGKDLNAALDTEGQLVLNSKAAVGGKLTYKAASDSQLVQQTGASVTGEVLRKDLNLPQEKDLEHWFGTAYVMFKIFAIFSLLVVGLVFVTLIPKYVLKVKEEMTLRAMPSLGWGLVYVLATPVVIMLLAITVIGIPLALILVPVYLIALCLAKVFAAFVVGLMILDKTTKSNYAGSLVWPLVLGLVVVVVATSIPVLGWLAETLLVLWALGAMMKVKKDILKEYR